MRTCTSSSLRGSPLNSGKFLRMSTVRIFSTSRSVLLRKRMMETFRKSLLLTMVSKMFMLSTRRFVLRSSIKTWNNTHSALLFAFFFPFPGLICAAIKDSVAIIWPLIWTGATTVGTIKFPQRTTKIPLYEPLMMRLPLVHFITQRVKRPPKMLTAWALYNHSKSLPSIKQVNKSLRILL